MSLLIDFLAISSIVGIWPRYVEPRRLSITELIWELDSVSSHLDGLKIAHLSDLHFHKKLSGSFLKKIIRQIDLIKPDLLLFTGDFLCYSKFEQPERLSAFLNELRAPLGSFCTLGNHDYARYVTLNSQGEYDVRPPPNPLTGIFRSMRVLFSKQKPHRQVKESLRSIPLNEALCELLKNTPFQLLENRTVSLPIGLNLTGLGDMALGRCSPQVAFADYNDRFPGIVLSHNPDTFPSLLPYPGQWILSGHTHGEQIHLPWPKWGRKITQKLARLQNTPYTRGLFKVENKALYVNRGLGCHKPFRLFSTPEICVIKAIYK